MQILGNVDPGVSAPQTAPTSLSAIPTNTNVAISFTNPSNDGGSPITNYEYSFNNSSWTAISPADAISPVTVSSLSGNTAYSVYLRAVNIVGSGPASSAVTFTTLGVPTVTIASTTNYNQNSAVFNGTVNSTGGINITAVEFQYSTSSSFASGNSAWFTATTNSTITSSATNTLCTYNATGLTAGTLYYVRFRATNTAGTSTSSGSSFTTYSLRTVTYTSGSGTWTNPVPTSGTSGLAITSIADALVVGGGGGVGLFSGGGGGVAASNSISTGSSLSYVVGVAGTSFSYPASGTAGGSSSLTSSAVWTMSGAGGGYVISGSNAASSGAGSGGNTANSSANAGGTYVAGCVDYAEGGAGGAGGVGQNAYYVVYTAYGGNGGAAVTYYGITVSSGGAGPDQYGDDGFQNGTTPASSYGGGGFSPQVGTPRAPQAGLVRFTYYGP